MRLIPVTFALLTALAVPASASASPVNFTFVETGGPTVTFTLDSTTSPDFYNNGVNVDFFNVTMVTGSNTASGTVFFTNPTNYQGADFYIGDGVYQWFNGAQVYTGPEASPTFLDGTYQLGPGTFADDENTGTLTINGAGSPSLSATPEPSSLVLLGTGILGAAGAARRRIFKAA